MGIILLEGLEFFAFHGCFKEERIIGSRFLLTLSVETATDTAEQSDNLSDTVDYASLYQVIRNEFSQKSHLLEHVAHRIIQAVSTHYPQILSIDLKISKVNPPLGGKVHTVSYLTHWKK